MITMNKAPKAPYFSSIVTNSNPNNLRVYVRTYPVGKLVLDEINNFNVFCDKIETDRKIIMPDHIHFVLKIKEYLPLSLEFVLEQWQEMLFQKAKSLQLIPLSCQSLFEKGFNDIFFNHSVKWNVINNYIQDNPRRLWERWQNPKYFHRSENMEIYGVKCQLYGNISLLDNPLIYPVIVHRSDIKNSEVLNRKKEYWKYSILNGGVIAGAFRNEVEKEVRNYALNNGGRIIYLKDKPFEEKEKPKGKYYDFCKEGKLLYLYPEMHFSGKYQRRQECLYLNSMANSLYQRKPCF